MKRTSTLFIIFVIVLCNLSFSQNASDYFPSDMGHKWYFQYFELDSLNNPVDLAALIEVDSLASTVDFHGKSAKFILSKLGAQETLSFVPYNDSSYVSFDGSNAYNYFGNLGFSIPGLSANIVGKKNSGLSTSSLTGWQLAYQFGAAENASYNIVSGDTAVTFDSTALTLNISTTGMRLPDENINTDLGNFDTKKFLITTKISIPFGPFNVHVLTINDTTWIAQGNWIVKSIVPSSNADLSTLGLSSFYVPGHQETITNAITAIREKNNLISDFHLYQNYPNPFNPSTKIKYSISSASKVKLIVYNLLGKEIATLVDRNQNAGTYEVDFNPSQISGGLPSGIYFYRLESQNKSAVRKLVYLK